MARLGEETGSISAAVVDSSSAAQLADKNTEAVFDRHAVDQASRGRHLAVAGRRDDIVVRERTLPAQQIEDTRAE